MFSHKIDDVTELRILQQQHAEELFALVDRNREHLREWLLWVDGTKTVEDTKNFIKGELEKFAAGEGLSTGIWYEGKLSGSIGSHRIDWIHRKVEIGYWISAAAQGKGLITKGTRALVDYFFNELELHRVEIHCAIGNKKSRAIAERLGFTEEGILKQAFRLYDHYTDIVIYGLLKK